MVHRIKLWGTGTISIMALDAPSPPNTQDLP